MKLFENTYDSPVGNAQTNLMGRTHYVDPHTLRYHKSRVVYAKASSSGLLFYLITSDALDYNNTKRGFRWAVFDLFGSCLMRVALKDAFRTKRQAERAMWVAVEPFNEIAHTLAAIDQARAYHSQEMDTLTALVERKYAILCGRETVARALIVEAN
jgi:hypothetical protein